MIRLYWLILTFCICASSHADKLSAAQRDSLFAEALHILGGSTSLSARWTDTVTYQLVTDSPSLAPELIGTIFKEISDITGINAKSVGTRNLRVADYIKGLKQSPEYSLVECTAEKHKPCANFVVVLTSQDRIYAISKLLPLRRFYQKSIAGSTSIPCFFAPGINAEREIKRGFVFINADLDSEMISTCLHEEIYQSFGLFGDVTDSEYFSFNNVVAPKTISHYDSALLAALYHSSYAPGTPVRKIAAKMLVNLSKAETTIIAELP